MKVFDKNKLNYKFKEVRKIIPNFIVNQLRK